MHYVDLKPATPRRMTPQWQAVDMTPARPPTVAELAGAAEAEADFAGRSMDHLAAHLGSAPLDDPAPWSEHDAGRYETTTDETWSANHEQIDTALDDAQGPPPPRQGAHWPSLLLAGGALAFAWYLARR